MGAIHFFGIGDESRVYRALPQRTGRKGEDLARNLIDLIVHLSRGRATEETLLNEPEESEQCQNRDPDPAHETAPLGTFFGLAA